jgi:hypothetical protein
MRDLEGSRVDENFRAQIQSIKSKLDYKLPCVFAFTFIHDLYSYFFFCILVTAIDIATIRKLKKSLSDKSRLAASSAAKQEDQNKAEIRSIIMIVLNSLSNFYFRAPELVVAIFFYFISFGHDRHAFKIL